MKPISIPGTNKLGLMPSPDDGSRSIFRNVVSLTNKRKELSKNVYHFNDTPSSKDFAFYSVLIVEKLIPNGISSYKVRVLVTLFPKRLYITFV
jgi:hypothetical protein